MKTVLLSWVASFALAGIMLVAAAVYFGAMGQAPAMRAQNVSLPKVELVPLKESGADVPKPASLIIDFAGNAEGEDLPPDESDGRKRQRVGAQPRDPLWANGIEREIGTALRTIPYLATSTPLIIKCGQNVCEAEGGVMPDASTSNRDLAMNYLENKGFIEPLGRANAYVDQVVLNRESNRFKIYFSRLRK